ncbi:MAG: cytochrome c3 family protein [Gemmatimonadetes bacterium]|nr:cytochrome c3 family protein [Gemmatimonadota bacterium]
MIRRVVRALLIGGALATWRPVPLQAAAPPASAVVQDTVGYGCVICHADKRRAFQLGVHADRGIRCDRCHGGNPKAFALPAAHTGRFLGKPSKVGTALLCGSCHSDPDQMRQYGLPAGQLAELKTSRHGQLLFRGNTDVPTCTNCHDAHTVLPPVDARSSVYPTNIPGTCAGCHQNKTLMARYGLPTGQLVDYEKGAHGTALFERQNFAAPTCIGCHGSHAALPPRVTEIVHVCDRCHAELGRALYRGPHGQPALSGKLPGCLGCHTNHSTERVPPERIAAVCTRCHTPDSPAALRGVEIQRRVVQAMADKQAAEQAIEDLVRSGRQVTDERFRYQTLITDYQQIAEVQHSLDLDQLDDLRLRVGSVSASIRTTAERAAEQRWEHKLILIPVWFLALAAVALVRFKFSELGRRGE